MIIYRLTVLAVCLLVLLYVASTMEVSRNYNYYRAVVESNCYLCLSFKKNTLVDICRNKDSMQKIYTTKPSNVTMFFHLKDFRKILCFNEALQKFKLKRYRDLHLSNCSRTRHHRSSRRSSCRLNAEDVNRLRRMGCELYDHYNKFFYISAYKGKTYFKLKRRHVKELGGSMSRKTRYQQFSKEDRSRQFSYPSC